MKFAFIKQHLGHAAGWTLGVLCRVIGVTRSGFYAWRTSRKRPASPRQLTRKARRKRVAQVFEQHKHRYGMAPGHWQIVNHSSEKDKEGGSETLLVKDAPEDIVKLAVRSANLMGDCLYGVDLKEVRGKAVVIEVNDNPNIDVGCEDEAIGDELYVKLMQYYLDRLER